MVSGKAVDMDNSCLVNDGDRARTLGYFRSFICFDDTGRRECTLETKLRTTLGSEGNPVKKQKMNKGPHPYVWVAKVNEAIEYAKKLNLQIEIMEDKNANDMYTQMREKYKIEIDRLKIEIDRLKEKNSKLELSANAPLSILKSKKEIIDDAKIFMPKCGIYFLLEDSQIVYVGQSVNIYARIANHANENLKKFTHYSFIECDRKDLSELEALYIGYLAPKLNTVMPITKQQFIDLVEKIKSTQDNVTP